MKPTRSVAASVVALLALGGTALAEMPTSVGEGEGQVDIVAWPGYIERGETDKDYDWVTEFEKETGCKVNVKTAGTSDEMVALMNEGGFDLVTASGDASLRLIAGKHGAADQHRRSSRAGRPSTSGCRTRPGTPSTASTTACPTSGARTCSMYNTKVFKEAPKSWNVVFEEQNLPDGKRNKGRVQAYRRPDLHRRRRAVPDEARSRNSASRIRTSSTRTSTRRRSSCCAQQRTLVGRYWHDAIVQIDDFKNEGVVASGSWPFQVNMLQAREAADRHRPSRRRARPAGPTPR